MQRLLPSASAFSLPAGPGRLSVPSRGRVNGTHARTSPEKYKSCDQEGRELTQRKDEKNFGMSLEKTLKHKHSK